jgi:hypothetical protein
MKSVSYRILEILKNYYHFANEDKVKIQQFFPQPESFTIVNNEVVMIFTPSNFDEIKYNLNQNTSNNLYNIRGFYLKNSIIEFTKTNDIQFDVLFKLPVNKNINDNIEISGFTPNSYNGSYKIITIDKLRKKVSLIKQGVADVNIVTNGYASLEYFGGINKITPLTLIDAGYQVKYTIDTNSIYCPKQTNDLDLTKKPVISKVPVYLMSFETFETNNKVKQREYLIIDSASFTIDVAKNPNNLTDSVANIINLPQYINDIYTGDIYYIGNRNADNENNKTQSGGDIELKQEEMLSILRGLLLHIRDEERCYVINSTVDRTIIEGSFTIKYTVQFTKPVSIANTFIPLDEDLFPINQLQINTDTILI